MEDRAKVVSLAEIKAEDWTLNLSRYVLPPISEEIPPLPEAVAAFKQALAECRAAEDRLREVLVEGGARMNKAAEHLSQQELESYLWGAAKLLRGLIDAGDYKQYVFPLLFFKRLSDVWDEECENALKETGDKSYIFKFAEAGGVLNNSDKIIAMVDEAHRTQEGDLGRKMREALPNAFLFGLTGTPINRIDRNTFNAFGAEKDTAGYMSRYGFEESVRDGATMPLHFEPRLLDLHIDKEAIDQAFKELTGNLSDLDKDQLAKTAAKMAVLVKAPERIHKVCADIARHFQERVAPSGFGAQVVTFDRESCMLYKKALDEYLPPEFSDIVMTVNSGEDEYAPFRRERDAEEQLLDRFRNPADPLKILIVTSKLLTGFDAPILQAMYLDKPMRDHTLLQAICRTNRPYGEAKTHGLIVDYLGVFDDVAQAIQFDEGGCWE